MASQLRPVTAALCALAVSLSVTPPALARQYGADPHGDAQWEIGARTAKEIKFDYEKGRTLPKLRVSLPARPKDKDQKVEKKTVEFHLTIKNLW